MLTCSVCLGSVQRNQGWQLPHHPGIGGRTTQNWKQRCLSQEPPSHRDPPRPDHLRRICDRLPIRLRSPSAYVCQEAEDKLINCCRSFETISCTYLHFLYLTQPLSFCCAHVDVEHSGKEFVSGHDRQPKKFRTDAHRDILCMYHVGWKL